MWRNRGCGHFWRGRRGTRGRRRGKGVRLGLALSRSARARRRRADGQRGQFREGEGSLSRECELRILIPHPGAGEPATAGDSADLAVGQPPVTRLDLGVGAVERDDGRVAGRDLGRRLHLEGFGRERVARVWDALDVLYRHRFGRGGCKDGGGWGSVCRWGGFGLWFWLGFGFGLGF